MASSLISSLARAALGELVGGEAGDEEEPVAGPADGNVVTVDAVLTERRPHV